MSNQNLAACFQAFIKNMMQSPTKRGEWFLQLMIEKRDQRLTDETALRKHASNKNESRS